MIEIIHPTNEKNEFINVLKPYPEYKDKILVFLAGPCPRKNYETDWRNDAIKYIKSKEKELKRDLVIFNPTNSKYNEKDPDYLFKQTSWETDALKMADRILFWIPRSLENPGLTTNIELGEHMNSPRAAIGLPPYAIKNEYIKCRLRLLNKAYYEDLYEMIDKEVLNYLKK